MSNTDSTTATDVVEFAIPADDLAPLAGWYECAAVRFVREQDTVRLEITHRPRCEKCDGTGAINAAGPHGIEAFSCHGCGGTGRAAK